MVDIAIQIADTIVGFLPYLIAAIIVIVIIAFLARRKGSKEEDIERPPIIEPEDKFIDMQKKELRSQGQKVRFKSYFRVGETNIAKVKKYMSLPLSETEEFDLKKIHNKKGELEKLRAQVIGIKIPEDDHYILETLNFGFINALLYVFGYRMDFRIIPMSLVNTNNSNSFNCPAGLHGRPYFDRVYTYSKAAEKYIQDFHDHMTLKQTLKEQVNFIPQMHYFDYKTGRFAAKAQELADIKDKSHKRREHQFAGTEVPEDENLND